MYYCFLKKVFNLSTLLQEYGDSLNCQAGCSKETGSKDRYNNRSYESFVKNGFADAIPRSISGPHDRMQKFLSIVDLRKGEIERSVRLRAPDWNSSTKKNERREFIYYAKDWLGIPITKWRQDGHIEGRYTEVMMKPKLDERTG